MKNVRSVRMPCGRLGRIAARTSGVVLCSALGLSPQGVGAMVGVTSLEGLRLPDGTLREPLADRLVFDPQVVQWSKQHATGGVPLAIFEDQVGPPTYLLNREADVTVLLSVKQKVVANFAFRKGELNDQAIEQIIKTAPRLVKN